MDSPFTSRPVPTPSIVQTIDAQIMMYANQRKPFERRWYDNNFFDDGYHFRYISRTTGKIVDLSNRSTMNLPSRAIPKASRQIRGVANLLMAPEYVPVVYPVSVSKVNYSDPNEYQQALDTAKKIAQKTGSWLTKEFKDQDLEDKLILMIINACKHGVSWLEVWPDAVEEKIMTEVFDAFEIYCMGNLKDPQKSPSIIKAVPQLISTIKANENFDQEQLRKISPDNKYASSEIKQAYMQARYGSGQFNDQAASLILKESFMKEYLSEDNIEQVQQMANDPKVLEGKKIGDMVMRHTFTAGGVWLQDEYIDLDKYPFVDLRLEPGPIYGVPLIERFIPANKSLDIVMSRIERFISTMVTGTWLTRAGEDLQITNIPGGQQLEYKTTPPTPGQVASIPPFVFNFVQKIEEFIDEQGAAASSFNQLPDGVKSGIAIESVKSTEYSNLKIPSMMIKRCVKQIAEQMMCIAHEYVDPQTVYFLEKGEPQYFDIIGKRGMDKRQELGMQTPDAIPVDKDSKVEIEVESGLGFTMEGKKNTMQQIITFLTPMIEAGLITQDAVKVLLQKMMTTFQFGATQDFMDALDTGTQSSPLTEDQLKAIQVAVLQTLKDSGLVGPEADQKMVDSTKVGTLETLKDTGLLDQLKKEDKPEEKKPSISIGFKDLPPEGKTQAAAQAGIILSNPQVVKDESMDQAQSDKVNAQGA